MDANEFLICVVKSVAVVCFIGTVSLSAVLVLIKIFEALEDKE